MSIVVLACMVLLCRPFGVSFMKERLWISGVRIETFGFVFAVFGYLL